MNKQSTFRVILNVVLIVIAILSVVATGFVSIKGYRSNRMPEMYTDMQIAEVAKEEDSGENENRETEKMPEGNNVIKNEWGFENSDWSVTAADGTKYEVLFLPDLEVRLYVQECSDAGMPEENNTNEDLGDNNSADANLNANELKKTATCHLLESDDKTFLEGTFEGINESPILLTVTEDSVKLMSGSGDTELIMEKK